MSLAAFLLVAAVTHANLETVESLVIEATNDFRAGENLARLKRDARLDDAARSFAEHLAHGGVFAHESGGTTPELRVLGARYQACLTAENLARHYSSAGFATRDLAQRLVQGWKDSPGHRRNMLEPDALDTGLAVVHRSHDGVEDFYAVQLLARNRSASVQFKVRNRSAARISYVLDGRQFTLEPEYAREHSRCSKAQVEFEDGARGRFEPAKGDCLLVPASGEVRREPGGCG